MSRNVSILSVVAATAMVTVLSVATVAFAEQEDGGDQGQKKVTLCHNGHIIAVGEPAQEAPPRSRGHPRGMRADHRHEHPGNTGNHHDEPYEHHHGYDQHHRYDKYNDPCCGYDNGYDGCYCRHLHGHYGKHL